MNGRFTPVDDLSNAFSLLSPRPFSRQAQYSSFSEQRMNNDQQRGGAQRPSANFGHSLDDPFFRGDTSAATIFDRHKRFMDEAFHERSGGRMSPRMTPLMPEWGYVGHAEAAASSAARDYSPSGRGERIIPIRVEATTGGRSDLPHPPPPPPPPQRPQQERSVQFREDRQPQQYSSVQHQPVVSAVYANGNKFNSNARYDESTKPVSAGSTGDLPSIGINLGKAPNLSSRLAKTTTYDEFADVLNRLPNRPEPRRDVSLDGFTSGYGSSTPSTPGGGGRPAAAEPSPPKRHTESPQYPTAGSRLQSSNAYGGSSGSVDRIVSEFERNVRVSSQANYVKTTKREGFTSSSAAPFNRLHYLR